MQQVHCSMILFDPGVKTCRTSPSFISSFAQKNWPTDLAVTWTNLSVWHYKRSKYTLDQKSLTAAQSKNPVQKSTLCTNNSTIFYFWCYVLFFWGFEHYLGAKIQQTDHRVWARLFNHNAHGWYFAQATKICARSNHPTELCLNFF